MVNSGVVNRQWLLARRPDGAVEQTDFRYHEASIPLLHEGDVLVRTLYFGYDASQRLWMTEDGGYMTAIHLGEPMKTIGIGQVIDSRDPRYTIGAWVEGLMAWEDYSIVRADTPIPLRTLRLGDYPETWNLSALGTAGLAAYFGLTDLLEINGSDVVVVSAASGATGSMAGGISKALGAKKVIGIASGSDKCRWLVEKAGFDAAIDYRKESVADALDIHCPAGVTAYFDNVGGETLDSLFLKMAPQGRVLISGAISSGYGSLKVRGPENFMEICTKMLTVKGLHLMHYRDRMIEGVERLTRLLKEKEVHVEEDIHFGFDRAPELLTTLYTGKRPGKLILKVSDPL
ncbi:NADPH-dependent curcumin reductase [Pseudomonas fluorescens]|uniref:NADPH-dependent curcumin reductase n=1 Tax=Pseudomonas fluorescens TaxID=294 RepID=A0A5E7I408_PSEFL|nr:NADP-dependent oxidoreductase [Pseudomonas fluorescens]VVO66613.1 NADPH-dependent curcumin reductase [Pseudomonas fluorescens]